DLGTATRLAPNEPTAQALRAVIAVGRRDLDEAAAIGERAARAAPSLAAPRMALAYVYQARGDVTAALREAGVAVAVEDTNATAWARLAELRLAAGDHDGSKAAVHRALMLNPSLGYAHSILGFAELAGLRSSSAVG